MTNKDKGNCIDKFIAKKLDKRIIELLHTRLNIRHRQDERLELIDYFNSGCYEKDFSSIIELRNIASNLLSDCNKFLERISEQYSKFN